MDLVGDSLPSAVDLVVLGGGPSGLAAAWEASLAGKSVLVVEREAVLGGLCATIERDGFRFDLGGHRIISKRATLVQRVRELLGDELEERSRKSVIWLDGERFSYPLVASELLRKLPTQTLIRAGADYAKEWLRAANMLGFHVGQKDDQDFQQWVTRRFGKTLYDLFFGPYTEKLWGISAKELSADWAAQRISLLNLADVAVRLTGLRHGGARTYARKYLYPTGGIGVLFERLASVLVERGVQFVTECTAVKLTREASSARICAVDLKRHSRTSRVECAGVVSTVPLGSLATLLRPERTDVVRINGLMRHRGLRFLNVMLDQPGPLLNATWMYVSDPRFIMTRVQEPAERSPSMTPANKGSLMIEVPCDAGDSVSSMTDQQLFDRVWPELLTLGVRVDRRRVRGVFSAYAPYAYPMYSLDYRDNRDALLRVVDEFENVWSIGRQGLFRYVFMDTAMEMGFAAAREFVDGQRSFSQRILSIDNNPTLHEVQSVTG